MEKIIVREAKEKDLYIISEKYILSWKKVFSNFLLSSTIKSLDINKKVEFFKCFMEDEEGKIFIAENKNDIVGYIVFKKLYVKSGEIISFYISTLYVKDGITEKLLKYLKKYCLNENISKIFLWTFKNNKEGINFYKNIGFYETGFQRQSLIESNQIEVQYLKNL